MMFFALLLYIGNKLYHDGKVMKSQQPYIINVCLRDVSVGLLTALEARSTFLVMEGNNWTYFFFFKGVQAWSK